MGQLGSYKAPPPTSCQIAHLGKGIIQNLISTCLLATLVSLETLLVIKLQLKIFLQDLKAMQTVSISDLPSVVINQVLENEKLSIADVINFCSTSKHFRGYLRNNNKLWKVKFFQRWPHFQEINALPENELEGPDFIQSIHTGLTTWDNVLTSLKGMSKKFFDTKHPSSQDWREFVDGWSPTREPRQFPIIIHELACFLNDR